MPKPKANILVVFYSRDGSVEALAKSVSEGAPQARDEVRLRRVPEIASPAVRPNIPAGRSAARGCPPSMEPQCQPTRSGTTESSSAPQHVLVIRLRKHSGKARVDTIVIDHLEKTPTD